MQSLKKNQCVGTDVGIPFNTFKLNGMSWSYQSDRPFSVLMVVDRVFFFVFFIQILI